MLPEEVYITHKEEITGSLARFSRDYEAAADAVQEAFVKALINRDFLMLMPEKAFVSWLYTTAKNLLVDMKRRESRLISSDGVDEPFEDTGIDDRLLSGELLARLPENLRKLVTLRYYAGYNSAEIGLMESVSAATVRTRLRAAIAVMRSYIKED